MTEMEKYTETAQDCNKKDITLFDIQKEKNVSNQDINKINSAPERRIMDDGFRLDKMKDNTIQPPKGRSKDGGLKMGEMETDTIITQCTAKFLLDIIQKQHTTYIIRD